MTSTETLPVSTWRFDSRVRTRGTAGLQAVAMVSADEAWAVGNALSADTGRGNALVARWRADDFTLVEPAGAGCDQDVRLLGVDWAGDDVWAVGSISEGTASQPRVERYCRQGDGPGEAVPAPVVDKHSAFHAVAMLSPCEGWAVGGSGRDAAFTDTLVARWDGTAWQAVPSPSPGTLTNRLDSVAARSADDVWAVGHYTGGRCDDDRPMPLALHWDGESWTEMPVPDVADGGSMLLTVGLAAPRSVWVAGTGLVTDPASGMPRDTGIVVRWNGRRWRSVFRKSSTSTAMTGVAAVSDTDVWFAAYSEGQNGRENAQIDHWDGKELRSAFSGLGGRGNVASALSGIAAAGDRRTAVGWLVTDTEAHQQPAALIGDVTA